MFYEFDGTEADSGEVYLPVNQILQPGAYFIGIECFTSNGQDTIRIAYEDAFGIHKPEASINYLKSGTAPGLYTNPDGVFLMRLNQSKCDSVTFSISGNVVDNGLYGEISNIQIIGGKEPFKFYWTGPNLFSSTSLHLDSLCIQGTYTLNIFDKNGCFSSQDFFMPYFPCPGINESEKLGEVIIQPNPSAGNIEISLNNKLMFFEISMELFNIQGKSVFKKEYNSIQENLELDLSYLEKGLYLFKLSNSENTYTNTLIIK